MSVENLAARLDALAVAGVFVSESEDAVTVSNLGSEHAQELFGLISSVNWRARAFDSAQTEWRADTLDDAFEPFRIEIEKPTAPVGALRLLTNVGFRLWLDRNDSRTTWQIAGLSREVVTLGVRFTPWRPHLQQLVEPVATRSPRTLVREFSGQRVVPADLGRWLLLENMDDFALDNPAIKVWAEKSSRMLMLSLPDEYDEEAGKLRFKGPPRLDLQYPGQTEDVADLLSEEGILALQSALRWVFELEREAEMRHILLATEIARCGGTGEKAPQFLRENLISAQEGAKIAYQMQLAGMSNDSLKTLAELRKTVTDDTAKVTDATRQIITSVASALAVGVGLVAARLTTSTNPTLVIVVLVIVGAYVATTILSGISFALLQRRLRKEWQPRLYRFLSEQDYAALVGKPARTAELALWWSSGVGAVAVILTFVAVLFLTPHKYTGDIGNSLEKEISVHQGKADGQLSTGADVFVSPVSEDVGKSEDDFEPGAKAPYSNLQ